MTSDRAATAILSQCRAYADKHPPEPTCEKKAVKMREQRPRCFGPWETGEQRIALYALSQGASPKRVALALGRHTNEVRDLEANPPESAMRAIRWQASGPKKTKGRKKRKRQTGVRRREGLGPLKKPVVEVEEFEKGHGGSAPGAKEPGSRPMPGISELALSKHDWLVDD